MHFAEYFEQYVNGNGYFSLMTGHLINMVILFPLGMAFMYCALEYFHTLELEVSQPCPFVSLVSELIVYSKVAYVWGDRLSSVKVLFLVTRYLGFITNGLLMSFCECSSDIVPFLSLI